MQQHRPRKIRKALVTGGTGFIGGHLIERLRASTIEVKALVRDVNRARWLHELGVELIHGDIRDAVTLDHAVQGIDTVFHAAAVLQPATLAMEDYRAVNAAGTRHLIEACRRTNNIERFVYISTVTVLGASQDGAPLKEESCPQPVERYGITKWEGETIALEAARTGFPVVVARPGWTYGPRATDMIKLFRRIASRRFLIVGPARNLQQPLWIGDLIEALLRCATFPDTEGKIYNFAGPHTITTRRMCEIAADAIGVAIPRGRPPVWFTKGVAYLCEALFPLWQGTPPIVRRQVNFFVLHYTYSTEKACLELGWAPQVGFEEGALRTVEWWRSFEKDAPAI